MSTEFEALQPGALLARVHPGDVFGPADEWRAVYVLDPVMRDAMCIKGLMGSMPRNDWRELVRKLHERQVRELIALRKPDPQRPWRMPTIPLGVFDADGLTCRASVAALANRFL